MPIQALSEHTTRVLGSSLVLTDARSVVKELVDNALDARATAISVEISNNTLDVIQVKDNGIGIDIQDRQLLCKRGCTSKIESLEDLDRLGGSFLGFRGEALASIVELSQAVVVTTRVDGEVVGTSVKYAASGMTSSSSASHPVGTTVRVQDFLSKLPVRKQTALKENMKTLQAIRLLLFSFAFARPEVRLSFRVLKGKNDKINWTYAATSTSSVTEVATKILGKEIASECLPCGVSSDDCDVDLGSGWNINALLLSGVPGSANTRNARQYISIDGRPVNTDRGTMLEVARSYKRHLQKIQPTSESSSVSKPFLFMQIQCPPQSYDVNVEPTKDEVLFARPDQLLSLVECLFGRAYSMPENRDVEGSKDDWATPSPAVVITSSHHTHRGGLAGVEREAHTSQQDNFPVAADTAEILTPSSSVRNPFTIAAMNAQIKPRKMDSNQATATSDRHVNALEGREEAVTSETVPTTETTSRKSSECPSDNSNSLASLSPRPGPSMRRPAKTSRTRENEESGTPIPNDSNAVAMPQKSDLQGWLTPKPGSHLSSPSNVIYPSAQVSDAPKNMQDGSDTSSRSHLDLLSPPFSSQTHRGWGAGQKPFKMPRRRQDEGGHSGDAPITPPPSFPNHHQVSLQKDLQGLPAISEPSEACTEDAYSDQQVQPGSARASRERSPDIGPLRANSELDDIMDFEHRKKAAIAHQRRAMRSITSASRKESGRSSQPELSPASPSVSGGDESEPVQVASGEDYGAKFGLLQSRVSMPLTSNPHRNRYLKALQDLSHPHPPPGGELQLESDEQSNMLDTHIPDGHLRKPELPTDDPRAYFMKHREKSANGKIYRTKSSKLPLERSPPESTTFNLVLSLNVFKDIKGVNRQVETLSTSDPYVTHGRTRYIDFDDCSALIDEKWRSILQKMVKTSFRSKADDGKEVTPEDLRIVVSKVSGS